MQSSQEVQQVVGQLGASVWAFNALRAAQESGLLALLSEPRDLAWLAERTGIVPDLLATLLDVLAAVGLVVRDGDRFAAAPGLVPLLGGLPGAQFRENLRSVGTQTLALVADAQAGTLAPGWRHTDPEALQAQGLATAPVFRLLASTVFPQLAGLTERLQAPGGRFLDVGAGVGAVALVLCAIYPQLQIVGLEPQELPRQLAARNLAAAGLTERVEMRDQLIQDLPDEAAFDLVWLPQVFLPREVFVAGLATSLAALRPGGWLLAVTLSLPGSSLAPAVSRLNNVLFGGPPLLPEQVAAQIRAAGFDEVQIFPGPPATPLNFIVGRRTP